MTVLIIEGLNQQLDSFYTRDTTNINMPVCSNYNVKSFHI